MRAPARVMCVGQFQECNELRAAMPLAHESEYLPRQKVDAGRQRQRSVPDVLMVAPYGEVTIGRKGGSWYRRQVRSGILDGLHARLLAVGEHGH